MAISKSPSVLLLFLLFSATLSFAYTNREIDPEKELRECQERCQVIRMEKEACQRRCLERYEERKREHPHEEGSEKDAYYMRKREEGDNPYYFRSHHFQDRFRSEQGSIRVLERFGPRSELLGGIDNSRVAVLHARPNSFVLPHHCDAETLLYIARGRATISIVRKNKRSSHNVQSGDILRVPAGSILYLVNNDEREDLQIVKLALAVATPGRVEEFFAAGERNPSSYYTAFTPALMEAAFNTDWGTLQRLFQDRWGAIVHATREQIRALSKGSSSRGSDNRDSNWFFGHENDGESEEERIEPYRLVRRAQVSNQYGKFYIATPDNYKPLRASNVAISLANFTNGGMTGPYYNTLSTKISFVVQGKGYYEMVCPHLASEQRHQEGQQEGQERETTYVKVGATLSPGDVIVSPAGHPVVVTSSSDQEENLVILCYEFFANNNEMVDLAGQNNALKQVEDVAKELSYGAQARQIDDIFNRQRERHFYPGPESRQHQGRAYE